MNDTSTIDIDSLLDSSIDDLADMPEFSVYPAGTHKVIISFDKKEVNKHPCVELKMKAVETTELANPTEDKPLEPGAEGNVLFMMDNELGQGSLKNLMKQLAGHLGTSSISATMEAAKGMEVEIVSKPRWNKEKTQQYSGVTKFIL